MKHTKFSTLLLSGLLLTAVVSCDRSSEQPQQGAQAEQELISITQQQFDEAGMQMGQMQDKAFFTTITANGYIDVPPESKAIIGSYFGGKVVGLQVIEGQKVQKGERLAAIEHPMFIELQQQYLETRMQSSLLQKEWERKQQLSDNQITSPKELQQAETAYLLAQASQQALAEKLRMMQVDPDQLSVSEISPVIWLKSPISGYVAKVMAASGQWLNPEDAVINIVNTNRFRLFLDVFEKDIPLLKAGSKVIARLPDNSLPVYGGEIEGIGKLIDTYNRTVSVLVNITDGQLDQLIPGMFMTATIEAAEKTLPALPETAIIEADGHQYVLAFRKKEGDQLYFEKLEVETQAQYQGFTNIASGTAAKSQDSYLLKGGFQLIQTSE